jgi:aspartokinase-like uncharacterized kinase
MTYSPSVPSPAHSSPEIVKLGGSLVSSPLLPALLAHYAGRGTPVVIVPGGGPLADAVRDLQARLGLSDNAAHHMAILAMEQTALAFADIEPRLVPCADAQAIRQAHAEDHAVLWLPAEMARAANDLPASWDVTSDSLALWLGIELNAKSVLFVKSAPVANPNGPAEGWAASGLVDAYVPRLAPRFAGRLEAASVEDVVQQGSRAA